MIKKSISPIRNAYNPTGNRIRELNKKPSNRIELSRIACICGHEAVGQKRKYTGEPYWTHPRDVAELVERFGGSEYAIAAAWLHDLIEDTGMTLVTIEMIAGKRVRGIVGGLTDIVLPMASGGTRMARKAIARIRYKKADVDTKTVKLGDLIHNGRSIFTHDPGFAPTFWVEAFLLLEVLTGANGHLHSMLQELLDEYRPKLKMTEAKLAKTIQAYRDAEVNAGIWYEQFEKLNQL